VPECPTFLDLPARAAKPRPNGITHVLDKGLTPEATRAFLGQAAHLVDIVKVGWGIGYVDPSLPARVRMCAEHGSPVCLGGTLLEVAAMQDRVGELRDWALGTGITHLEVSNEPPTKAQQAWFVRQLGAHVNIGNVEPASVLALETLRLGLRADTVVRPVR
jgi:phosphosulfolactate synthase